MKNNQNNIRTTGTIYHDTGSKGLDASGKQRRKDCYRAEITIDGKRYRCRSYDYSRVRAWLDQMCDRFNDNEEGIQKAEG